MAKKFDGAILREVIVDGALGALAAKDAVAFAGLAITDGFRILKSELHAVVTGLTAGEATGLLFGIANGDLTAAEIEQSIEATGPLNGSDRQPAEQAERWVKALGASNMKDVTSVSVVIENEAGGPIITSKNRWTYNEANSWKWWIYNNGGSLTTGGLFQLVATHYGVWVG